MASINNLLNPSSHEYNQRLRNSHSPSSTASSPTENAFGSQAVDDVYYAREHIRPHPPHPHCPNALSCLQDSEDRPLHTLPVILRCAILGSPNQRLTIREIYAAMERKYPYYKTAGPSWKQSVRHHLSLNRLFERKPRPPTEPGFGSYWTVNLDAPPGTKRPRKRGRPNKDGDPRDDVSVSVPSPSPEPRKSRKSQEKLPARPPPSPTGRGGPASPTTLRPVDDRSFQQGSSLRASIVDEDEEDDEMDWDAEEYEPHASEEEHSEDEGPDRVRQRVASSSLSAPPTISLSPHRPGTSVLHGAFSGYIPQERPDATVERLQKELAAVRLQSSEASSVSLRLADQLKAAQQEARKTREALKVAERQLEDESRRRYDAERAAEEETQRRVAAEEALRAYQSQRRPPGHLSRP